ncbi:tol-pal system YbgF family protein [Treponema sp. Marseille-Q4132]|uniref:tetratricopeptide repeat protein n=1 Tax=Treponema sp. Marseille-Q4132 TaxID=2766701 RepID=UPI00165338D2|nr:hypothetical protein [Treponema sp. Marseille-Q4132]QNL97378.1 hypothetical protein H9I35_01040 [Treponema sp. Marseille-Q4132]
MKKSMKRTFVWKPIQVFFTALACLSIFSVSVSCASLPKSGRAGESPMQTENEGAPRQSENREGVSESAENENVSTTHGNNDAFPSAEKEKDAAETDGKSKDAVSTAENLSERVRVDLPEKSEEAMRVSSSIDEPVVREGFSENTGKGSKARNDTTASRTQKESAPKGKKDPTTKAVKDTAQAGTSSTQTNVNAAAENTKRAATETAQKTKGGTSERTINPAKSTADTQSAKDKDVGRDDKSAKDSEALRKAADSLADTDEIVTEILPSRSVHIAKNQYLDVVYPGGGWIYLGEKDGTKLLSFFGKRLGDADTIFTLRAKNAGKSMLHFYKNDVLTGDAIDDWLEVIVEDKTGSAAERITAPSYADTVPPRPAPAAGDEEGGNAETAFFETAKNGAEGFSEEGAGSAPISGQRADSESGVGGISASADESNAASFQNAQKQTVSATALSAEDYALGESDLLEKAKSAYDEKNYARALALLDLFFARATSRIDEGLYLKGQTLEAKSALQNIKGAIGAYDELLEKWPESKQWQSARKRSIYLKRMYVDIR